MLVREVSHADTLVTGGAGFIGSHAVEALLRAGERVRVLDNFSTGQRHNLRGRSGALQVVRGDVRDPAAVHAAVSGCARVLHLAAVVSVPRSFEDLGETEAVNVGGTANVLEAAVRAGVRRVVLASSCAVYGSTRDLPVRETLVPRPESPYAESKLRGEHLCRAACESGDVDVGVLRFFNVYGPRQDPSSGYSGVIALFMDRILRGQPCTVFGDGRQTRDFVFVTDVVAACLAALRAPRLAAEPLNVGTGMETSILGLLAALRRASNLEAAVEFAETRIGDVRRSRAACDRAADLLGFRSSVGFAEGVAATWAWYSAGAGAG